MTAKKSEPVVMAGPVTPEGYIRVVMYVEKSDFIFHSAGIVKMYADNQMMNPEYTGAVGTNGPPTVTARAGDSIVHMTNPTTERMESIGFKGG